MDDDIDDYDIDDDMDDSDIDDDMDDSDIEDDMGDYDASNHDTYGMDAEEAGFADGFFDSQMDNADYASFGASIDLYSLSDEERDNYEQAYLAGLDTNKNR